jgi:hypothetical protein
MPLSLEEAEKELLKHTPAVGRYAHHVKATILVKSDSKTLDYIVDLTYTTRDLLVERAFVIFEGFRLGGFIQNWADNLYIHRKIEELRKLLGV